ncbi:hypothetical protein [Companilactobacillus mishanensis]|uniref:hypothetical protein n=1 Tax=Companilactobacillus mishanensis TaxID=2486008 RepID=UPI001295C433|nr:hypothetical protein [Companilactobacillus mishanensis]MQS88772.1 hypothetical protein [Companilactobacillus mishanensis]
MKLNNIFVGFLSFLIIGTLGVCIAHAISSSRIVSIADDTPAYEKADFSEISNDENILKIKVKYLVSTDKPTLIISSPQIQNIDLAKLETEIGKDKVDFDDKNKKIKLSLEDHMETTGEGSFTIQTKNQNELDLSIENINNDILTTQKFNKIEKPNPDNSNEDIQNEITEEKPTDVESNNETRISDEENDPNSGWNRSNNMMLSPGKTVTLDDGSKATPFLYFGDFHYAYKHRKVRDSVGGRPWFPGLLGIGAYPIGQGHKNNVTAPNSALSVVPSKGSNTSDLESSKNQLYTTSHGDGQTKGKARGSQGTFVTTDLLNQKLPSADPLKPHIAGPDVDSISNQGGLQNIGMDKSSVKLYFRIDPRTNLQEQRLVFDQAYDNKRVRIRITQSFQSDNTVNTNIEYKNVGNDELDSFTGFAFKDIQLYKNMKVTSAKGNAKIRSLGNKEGIYLANKSFSARFEMFLNEGENEPYAWAGRTTWKTYKNNFINLNTPPTGFPWSKGTDALKGYYQSFSDLEDTGDKGIEPGAGKQWVNGRWDAGLAMHTKNQKLKRNQSVYMNYRTLLEMPPHVIPGIELHQVGSEENPDVIQPDDKSYMLSGSWYDYTKTRVEILGTLDDANTKEATRLLSGTQSEEEKTDGVSHGWEYDMPLDGVSPGKHTIRVWARNSDGKISEVKKVVILVPKSASDIPQIQIASPAANTSEDDPYNPIHQEFDLKGGWSDSHCDFVNITYRIGDGEEKVLYEKYKNPTPGRIMPWYLKNFQIDEFNDLDMHELTFTITCESGKSNSDTLYFQHKEGSYQFITPNTIDFGLHNLAPTKSIRSQPQLAGKLKVLDYRSQESSSLKVFLNVNKFLKEEPDTDDDEKAVTQPESLESSFYWHDTYLQINKETQISGEILPDESVWLKTTDLTREFEKSFALFLKANKNQGNGNYVSTWTWTATDSL